MRQFASSGFRLWNLGLDAKILYTSFCLLTLLGVLSSALYYGDLVGSGTRGIRRYYAGEAAPAAEPTATSSPPAGPTIELPENAEAARAPIVVPIGYRKLLEVTHFHLFTMPGVLLIVGHLFLATGLGDRAKRPWVVRYAGAGLAPLHALTGLALTLSMAVLTLYPILAMWRGPLEREGK